MLNTGKQPDVIPEKIYFDYFSGACLICKSDLIYEIGLISEKLNRNSNLKRQRRCTYE